MTLLDAYDRLAVLLDGLTGWGQVLDDLREVAAFIDVDDVARIVCVLDAKTRRTLRQLESAIVP